MKYTAIVIILLLLVPGQGMAARKKLQTISRDPYVAALAVDADSGRVFFSKNADAPAWPASVLKIMTMAVVLDQVARGRISLDEMVQVTREAASMGGSQVYLDPKEQFSVEDLLYALMVQSANDAAVALAIHVAGSKAAFVQMMNDKAEQLGMTGSKFYSVHGLPPGKGQNVDVTTANDLALLSRSLVKDPLVLKFTSVKERDFRGGEFIMRNHNKLLGQVNGCDGLKTGYFKAAGFSIVATAAHDGHRVISIVLGSRDRRVRDTRARELLQQGFAAIRLTPSAKKTDEVAKPAKTEVKEAKKQPADDTGKAAVQILESSTSPIPGQKAATPPAAPQPTAKAEQQSSGFMSFIWGLLAGLLICLVLLILRKRRRQSPYRYSR